MTQKQREHFGIEGVLRKMNAFRDDSSKKLLPGIRSFKLIRLLSNNPKKKQKKD